MVQRARSEKGLRGLCRSRDPGCEQHDVEKKARAATQRRHQGLASTVLEEAREGRAVHDHPCDEHGETESTANRIALLHTDNSPR